MRFSCQHVSDAKAPRFLIVERGEAEAPLSLSLSAINFRDSEESEGGKQQVQSSRSSAWLAHSKRKGKTFYDVLRLFLLPDVTDFI